jgi:hypothetical protein
MHQKLKDRNPDFNMDKINSACKEFPTNAVGFWNAQTMDKYKGFMKKNI